MAYKCKYGFNEVVGGVPLDFVQFMYFWFVANGMNSKRVSQIYRYWKYDLQWSPINLLITYVKNLCELSRMCELSRGHIIRAELYLFWIYLQCIR